MNSGVLQPHAWTVVVDSQEEACRDGLPGGKEQPQALGPGDWGGKGGSVHSHMLHRRANST